MPCGKGPNPGPTIKYKHIFPVALDIIKDTLALYNDPKID
jgi:hypothetical protein